MTCPNILLAITGGISAYKSAVLARLLIKAGCTVRVMMTDGACEFITPLTLQALTGNEVHTKLLDDEAERGMGHIELAKWADMVVIAPASANTIGRLAGGLADNLVTTVALATTAPIVIAPAMNQAMYAHAIVQDNLAKLTRFGYTVLTPDSGEQACGDVGAGRLPEPDDLCERILTLLAKSQTPQSLRGKKVIITAGATVEAIDPVRFLSNHSTGKMGFAIAKACMNAGADVTIVAGRGVHLPTPFGAKRITVTTADDMLSACQLVMTDDGDSIFIATAAVADYKVANIASQKIKKTSNQDDLTLALIKNPDILATISHTFPNAVMVGFAAETQDSENYAHAKLIAKNLDMIAVNDVSDKSIGFGSDDNAMTVFFAKHYGMDKMVLDKASKESIAKSLVECVARII
ncbi:bifunctional phosphopantothenoylcysteine decarboxylase/phosphopantothenate--cysteine ligase CoaBC [Moraxella nonliquefaciens]|uniref:Coenzyme A biosynthesis bifunctional protein CoaBC n=1 Tax=Moraxella nonliquefaciens TaxID=478 RepID=A0A1B8QHN1_MORNO|nr:bifunctional phosphopantothenoylcysteine decarboxylase/phosphopantothenate--cysteine ligase CoaBC [Moraxella nonliquefaciens]OBX82885.1 phosphopantothenoylcysteine decarboxylase [Moraxella nonliquefaciens]QPT45047.1 bifunctional phosphopantothenoylcysteine decarboxylase/phosphopantothenate--cysteine ligase CoaBC [Moraxella nonliquefaciens]QQC30078.1 bifunctional phosphopantothenoylcysteine decarboxylase/phosphopantothenate--cysteine ligase CoaBC [Moraxella nonliquefaciens]